MSANILSYLYDNKIVVQVLDTTASLSTRNRVVYSITIKVYQGVDNPIRILVRNQDQKPVDLSGYDLELNVEDRQAQTTVDTLTTTVVDATKGLFSVTFSKNFVNALELRYYQLTLKTIKQSDNTERPIYIDDNYGVQLDLQVLPGYYSDQAPVLPADELISYIDANGQGDLVLDLGTL